MTCLHHDLDGIQLYDPESNLYMVDDKNKIIIRHTKPNA